MLGRLAVPLDCQPLVLVDALALGVEMPKIVLRYGIALVSRLADPIRSCPLVLDRAFAKIVGKAKLKLKRRITRPSMRLQRCKRRLALLAVEQLVEVFGIPRVRKPGPKRQCGKQAAQDQFLKHVELLRGLVKALVRL